MLRFPIYYHISSILRRAFCAVAIFRIDCQPDLAAPFRAPLSLRRPVRHYFFVFEGRLRRFGLIDRLDQRPHALGLTVFDTPQGHGEHDDEGQTHADLHLFQAPDVVAREAEGDVETAVDGPGGGALLVQPLPLVADPGNGDEDASSKDGPKKNSQMGLFDP